jgi:hypothetical protein
MMALGQHQLLSFLNISTMKKEIQIESLQIKNLKTHLQGHLRSHATERNFNFHVFLNFKILKKIGRKA